MRLQMPKRLQLLYNKDGHDYAPSLPFNSFEHFCNKSNNNAFIFKMKKLRLREKLIDHFRKSDSKPSCLVLQPPFLNTYDDIFL